MFLGDKRMKGETMKQKKTIDSRIYRKVGKRYIPIGMEYSNHLSDGIWYVRSDGHAMTRLSTLPELDKAPQLMVLARTFGEMAIEEAMKTWNKKPMSLMDVARFVVDYIARKGV